MPGGAPGSLGDLGIDVTSWVIVSSARRIFGKVIRFICGQFARPQEFEVGMLQRDIVAR
jgi:hypothetical protein